MHTRRHVLFLQGGGEGTHDAWDNKLVESLKRTLGRGYELHYPRMPKEEDPSYIPWKTEIERALGALEGRPVVVGHSAGGTILLRLLAEPGAAAWALGGIFIVAAPFVGEGGWPSDAMEIPPDLGARLPGGVPIAFYQGLNDEIVPASHLDLYARAVPQARIHRLPDRDHQLNDDLKEVAAAIVALAP